MPGLASTHLGVRAMAPHVPALRQAIEAGLCGAHRDAYRRGGSAQPQEPDFVACASRFVPRAIAQSLVGQATVSVAAVGVFVHQSPMVTFGTASGGQNRCELGDLLIAARMPASGQSGHYEGTAILIQAKAASNKGPLAPGVQALRAANTPQYQLYSGVPQWPTFTTPAWGNPSAPLVLQAGPQKGVLGIVDQQPCGCSVANRVVHWGYEDFWSSGQVAPLAQEWANVAAFTGGTAFAQPVAVTRQPPDDWSYVITQLLQVTVGLLFNRQRSGFVKGARGQITLALSAAVNEFDMTLGARPNWQDILPKVIHSSNYALSHLLGLAGSSAREPRSGDGIPDNPSRDRPTVEWDDGRGFGVVLVDVLHDPSSG